MLKYFKIIDEETKLGLAAEGDNADWYLKNGYTKQDVEQSDINGGWYLKGYAPKKGPDELLDEAKVSKIQENKSAYEAALKSGVTYKGALFDCDTLAAVRIMGQMAAMQASAIAQEDSIDWFDFNYQPVTLSIPEFMELAGIVTLNTRRIETLNCSINTAIEAAETLEELGEIEIDYSQPQEAENADTPDINIPDESGISKESGANE